MRFDLLHPADQLVMIMQRIYAYGMTTTSGGNLSIRDDDGTTWITPSGVDKGSLGREDIIRVLPDGTCEGAHKPSVELPFHMEIYRIRPDLRAILHAHPPTLVAFSLAHQCPDDRLIPDVSQICGKIAMATYDVPGSEQLGRNIAEKFAEGADTVMLENHGCVCGAKDLFSAFMAFETLDFSGRMELSARKLGTPRRLTDAQLDASVAKRHPTVGTLLPRPASSEERAARRDMCRLVHRSYDQQLFTSTQGTFSQRLSDGSFLITPYGVDRKYLEIEDIVRIKDGCCEEGKTPSRSVPLHEAIYARHPQIGSIIIAHPASIMAFAVTDAAFDSRTIPESYILLRDVQRLPYMGSSRAEERMTAALTPSTPVALVENQCAIVIGDTLLNAFDRLEVLDYSARALLDAQDIGPVVMITDEELRLIEKAFNLE